MDITRLLKVGLFLAALVIAWLIYESIADPIRFEEEKNRRYEQVIRRLKDIRTMELAYKSVKGKYTDQCDSLIRFLREEKFMVIRKIGDAEDSAAVLVRDTIMVPVQDSLMKVFEPGFKIDSACYIPFGDGARFRLAAGEIEKGKVTVKVFEAYAGNDIIFRDMDIKNYLKLDQGLKVGSMTEPSTSGNWE